MSKSYNFTEIEEDNSMKPKISKFSNSNFNKLQEAANKSKLFR